MKRTYSDYSSLAAALVVGLLITLTFLIQPSQAQPQTVRIMPLGNSITRGGGSTGEVGYRRPLYLKLDSAGYGVDLVGSLINGTYLDFDRDHEGHGSYRADQLRDTVYDWLTDNPASIVLLHIGINDIAGSNEDPAEVEGILDSIDLWEQDNAFPVTVIVARIVLRWDGIDPETQVFNDSVEAIVLDRIASGDDLIMVDMEDALLYPDDLRDGVHPNDLGYAKMANVWFDALVPLLPEPDTISDNIIVSGVALAPSSPENSSDDSLLCTYVLEGTATTATVAWQRNDLPDMRLCAPFEGGDVFAPYDVSGSGNHVTPIGSIQWDSVSGYDGFGAFSFDGGYIDAGECLPLSASYTKAAWVRHDGGTAGNILSGDAEIDGHVFGLVTVLSENYLAAGHNGAWNLVRDVVPLSGSEWYFASVTYDYAASQMVLYKNGLEVG